MKAGSLLPSWRTGLSNVVCEHVMRGDLREHGEMLESLERYRAPEFEVSDLAATAPTASPTGDAHTPALGIPCLSSSRQPWALLPVPCHPPPFYRAFQRSGFDGHL